MDLIYAKLEAIKPALANNPAKIILTPAREAPEDTDESVKRWERCCDKCGTYCPPLDDDAEEANFFTGLTKLDYEEKEILFSFGMCSKCAGEADGKG